MRLALLALLFLAGCAPPQQSDADANLIADLEGRIAARDAEIGGLRAELAALKAKQAAKPASAARAAEPKAAEPEPVQVAAAPSCYKDYCPCELPQEGMELILCDQLETGQDMTDMLRSGRASWEARRSLAEFEATNGRSY